MTLPQLLPFFLSAGGLSGPVPTHQFVIRSGFHRSDDGFRFTGYSSADSVGSFVDGTTGTYAVNGKTVTILAFLSDGSNIIYRLSGTTAAADLPERIVCARGTLNVALRKSGEPVVLRNAIEIQYEPQSGDLANVFQSGQDTNVDIYQTTPDQAGSATLTFPNANSVRSDLTDADGITSVQEIEFILPGGSALRTSPTRLNTNSFRASVPLGTFGQWHVHWTYTDGLGAGKRASAVATRTL